MVTSNDVDMAAAVRISRRVDLRDVRLAHIAASSPVHHAGSLNPRVTHDCLVTKNENDLIEVACEYRFHAVSGEDEEVLEASLRYLLLYTVSGSEPIDSSDVDHFAFASGTLHSWPFARQLLFGLTANMGYPPFTLPVHKLPSARSATPAPAITHDDGETTEAAIEADLDTR